MANHPLTLGSGVSGVQSEAGAVFEAQLQAPAVGGRIEAVDAFILFRRRNRFGAQRPHVLQEGLDSILVYALAVIDPLITLFAKARDDVLPPQSDSYTVMLVTSAGSNTSSSLRTLERLSRMMSTFSAGDR